MARAPRGQCFEALVFLGALAASCGPPSTEQPPGGDHSAPAEPSSLSVTRVTGTSLTLEWSASTDDVGVAGYEVFRDQASAGVSPAPVFSFTGLSCGTAYSFGIRARDAAGNASSTATLSASTASCEPPPGFANVWIDQNGGSCTVSATPVAYAGAGDANSCASFDAAWDAMGATDRDGEARPKGAACDAGADEL